MSPSGRRPRHRPPWWPDSEAWPPNDEGGWSGPGWRHRGPPGWGRGGPGFRRPFGCLIVVFGLMLAGTLTAGIWALAALVGLVSAPPIVLAGGLAALVFVALAAAFAWRAVGRISAPIDDLAAAAERIELGDYSSRISERGPRSTRSLVRAFNQMSARLGDIDTGRRTFLAEAAHELRTPLSIIEGQLEAIEDGLYPADAAHLAPIHEQIRTLEKLIDDMRTVALADAGSLTLNRVPIEIGALAEEAVAAFQPPAGSAGVELSASIESGLPAVPADEQRLRQVMTNLLTNALRHTPTGGNVTVGVRHGQPPPGGDRRLTVEVIDDGAGIPAELLPTVFERFIKEPGSSGSGLGLAICRDVIEAHGGRIEITSQVGQGTTVTFDLPVS